MFTLYIVSLISCLVFWYGFTVSPDSEFWKFLAKEGYRKWPMLVAAFIPVINTLVCTILSLHVYSKMAESARSAK